VTILHIVPRTSVEEVFEIAITLAKTLKERKQIESQFYSFIPDSENSSNLAYGFESLIDSPKASLLDNFPEHISCIILHVNTDLYQAKGHVGKLKDALDKIAHIKYDRNIKVISVFHEIPTNRIKPLFFFNPFHQGLTQKIADISTATVTNNQIFTDYLASHTATNSHTINNFSRVGELKSNNLLGASRRNLVILGGTMREKIYRKKGLVKEIAQILKAERIVDIGPPIGWEKLNLDGMKIEKKGILKKQAISDQLTISRVGLLDYSRYPGCLGKSSIYNAYIAHGVAPLTLTDMKSDTDNIAAGVNYFTAQNIRALKSERSISRMARQNYANYQTHSQARWADLIDELL